MTGIDIAERVGKLVQEGLPRPADEVALDSHFEADLMMNSLALVRLLTRVEDEFGILLPEESLGTLYTVRELVSAVEALVPLQEMSG